MIAENELQVPTRSRGVSSASKKMTIGFVVEDAERKYVFTKLISYENRRQVEDFFAGLEGPDYEVPSYTERGYPGAAVLTSRKSRLESYLGGHSVRNSVPVEVLEFREDLALCVVGYQKRWLPIDLNRTSLEKLGLKVGDTFEWIPRADGVVLENDVVKHPGRLTDADDEMARGRTERLRERFQDAKTSKRIS